MELIMDLNKVDPAVAGLRTAVLYSGAATLDEVPALVQAPREALSKAGVDVPVGRDITVRLDRRGDRPFPSETEDEGDAGEVVVIVIDDGDVVIVIVIVAE
jgi:hypothetical protein